MKGVERILVLGEDPGKSHYGYSVVECAVDKGGKEMQYRVLECGQRSLTVLDMHKGIMQQRRDFDTEQHLLNGRYGRPDVYCVERFSSRGIKGTLIELVSLSIGFRCAQLLDEREDTEIRLVMPATWKNAFNKESDLKRAYSLVTTELHEFDATCIALYGACKHYGLPPFRFLNTRGGGMALIRAVEATSTSKVRVKRRARRR